MNSRELGLVNSAFNSLLGTMSTQSTQQISTENTFNKIFDNKMEHADKKSSFVEKGSQYEKVNREKTSAANYEQDNDREAYVKSDMQKPKKAIAQASSETKDVKKDEKTNAVKKENPTEETKAIESEDVTEVLVEEEAAVDNDVIESLMMLLGNDQLSEQEAIDQINALLSDLTTEEMSGLENLMGELKSVLLSLNGSLESFEDTLSKLSIEGSTFSNLLEGLEEVPIEETLTSKVDLETLETTDIVKDSTVEAALKETEVTEMTEIDDDMLEAVVPKEQIDASPKETKAEQIKAAEEATDKTIVVEGVNTESSAGQSNQQQSNTESEQSFAESLKFHAANAKSATMKTTTSNPFEEKIMQQIIKGTEVSMKVGKDVSEMMIKLNPKDLGNVSLKISLKNEQLVAEFSVENKTVKEVLESRLDDLKTALSDKGFSIEALDVSVNQDANEQFRSYEEFIKNQGKKRFNDDEELEGIEGIASIEDLDPRLQTLETTSSEINTLA